MDKNELYDLEIIDSGMAFEGIAKIDGKTIFVPGAIIGEKVSSKMIKVNSTYCIAKIENIKTKSNMRAEPFCEVFKRCGGCSAQHIEYDMQLLLKSKIVKNCLDKQGVRYPFVDNTIGMGMPYYYRNKVQYPVRVDNEGNSIIGFYSKRSHDIVENNCCYIQNRIIDMLSKEVFDVLIQSGFVGYNEKDKTGDIRHILIRRGYHTNEVMIVIVINKKDILNDDRFVKNSSTLRSKYPNIKSVFLNLNESDTNEILGDTLKLVIGENYISDYIGDFKFNISPKSFFQVNTLQSEVLYMIVKDGLELTGSEILFDLYSGVGTIGVFLSKYVNKVFGIEIEKDAVKMANQNIVENNISNAEYIAGSVEEKIEEYKKRDIHPDIIVVDPPRKGLDLKSMEYILEFKPKKIAYVSCNPSTLARDLKLLESDYDICKITPVDMFPQTEHVECVSLLTRKEVDKTQ